MFSADEWDIGRTDVIKHMIDVKDPQDLAYKGQFFLANDQLQLIKDNVIGWLCAGLIERPNSNF